MTERAGMLGVGGGGACFATAYNNDRLVGSLWWLGGGWGCQSLQQRQTGRQSSVARRDVGVPKLTTTTDWYQSLVARRGVGVPKPATTSDW